MTIFISRAVSEKMMLTILRQLGKASLLKQISPDLNQCVALHQDQLRWQMMYKEPGQRILLCYEPY